MSSDYDRVLFLRVGIPKSYPHCLRGLRKSAASNVRRTLRVDLSFMKSSVDEAEQADTQEMAGYRHRGSFLAFVEATCHIAAFIQSGSKFQQRVLDSGELACI